MNVLQLTFNPFQESTYVLYDETKEAILIDCGCFSEAEQRFLEKQLEELDLKIVKLVNTHLHIDHVFGYQYASEKFGMLTHAHQADEFLLSEFSDYAERLGLGTDCEVPQEVGTYLKGGEKLCFGNTELEIFHIPGHTPGHLCFFHRKSQALIVGDCLFKGSIGRTDFPYGNHEELISGIKNKLLPLGDEVVVYAGHGPNTTLGEEKVSNPFL